MNHQDCYRLLEIEPGCDWDSLRTAYRRQVQKWHPDRYQQEPAQQARAAERIQQVNRAFEELSEYYETHGRLPDAPKSPPPSTPPPSAPPRDDIERAFEQIDDIFTAAPERPKVRRNIGAWLSLVAVMLISYVFFTHADLFPRESHTAMPESRETQAPLPVDEPDEDIASDPVPEPLPINKPKKVYSTFARGATPGEVYAAQGIPTRTVGDIWYYGQSEVHFNHGQVVRWYSAPTDPLNVQTQPKPETPKSSATPGYSPLEKKDGYKTW